MNKTKIDELLCELGFDKFESPQFIAKYKRTIEDEGFCYADHVHITVSEFEFLCTSEDGAHRYSLNLSTEELLLFLAKQQEIREGL